MYDRKSEWPIKCTCGNEFTKTVESIRRDGGAKCFDCGRKLFTNPHHFNRVLAKADNRLLDPWEEVKIHKNTTIAALSLGPTS